MAGAVAYACPSSATAGTNAAASSSPNVLNVFSPFYMAPTTTVTDAQAVAIAQSFNLVVAPPNSFPPYLKDMRSANPSLTVLQYVNGMYSLPSLSFPANWYSHTSAGQRISTVTFPTWLMDPSQSAWANYVSSACATGLAANGYDGCFIDNLGLGPFVPSFSTGTPIDPATGTTWSQTAWLQYTSTIPELVNSSSPGTMVADNGLSNGQSYFSTTAPTSVLTGTASESMAEQFLRGANQPVTTYKTTAAWLQDVNMIVQAESAGHGVLATTKLWVTATAAQVMAWHEYALASFLLGAGGHSYFSFSSADTVAGLTTPSSLDHLNLGGPLQAYSVVNGVYERPFAAGMALVNPSASSLSISLGATYRDPRTGKTLTSVTLAAESGLVLTT